ncbi:alcohol dehydrogenase [bacterium J17]|nr:alcohol dehydrogenase [bacterium J17]
MRAMQLESISKLDDKSSPLKLVNLPIPEPKEQEIRIKINACGVCHTELDEIEGRTPPAFLPIILGHEIIGQVDKLGPGATSYKLGDRVGVGWIHSSSGTADENLVEEFKATGRDVNGGYAEFVTIPEKYVFPIPEIFDDFEAAPLLCAGGVGYRALKLTQLKDGNSLGLTGFGGSGHIVLQLCRHLFPKSEIYVFARNKQARDFAIELGADWAGATEESPPKKLDAIIDTTPAWKPIVEALNSLKPGGRLVINAIRKEGDDKDYLQNLSYEKHLWMEKEIKTVANVTGSDLAKFLPIAAKIPIKPKIELYPLIEANRALIELKQGDIKGAKVLLIGENGSST